jgi:hypothetical protein
MYENWFANAAVVSATVLTVVAAVLVHYEGLIITSKNVIALFFDLVYLSAMSYTTVGFGDVAPIGPIRFLTGTEALTGFVLIAWSASFTYLEMERYWKES